MTNPPQPPERGGWDHHPTTGVPAEAPQQEPAWYGNQASGLSSGVSPGQPSAPEFPLAPDWTGVSSQHGPDQAPEDYLQEEPRRTRTRWVVAVGVLLVVLGGVGFATWWFVGQGGPGEPRPVAQDVVNHVNSGDFRAIEPHLCTTKRTELRAQLRELERGRFDITLGKTQRSQESATARLTGTFELGGASHPVDQTMGLVVEDGAWKVCRLVG